jgi:TonB family protein
MRLVIVLVALLVAGCSKEFAVRDGGTIDPASFNLVQPIRHICQALPGTCDEPPILLAANAPRYPAGALAEGRSGHAEVNVIIDASGSTFATKLLNATAPEFGEAAVAAVHSWRFEPARKAGVPVSVEGKIIFPFVVR